jgi:hypothetical protein
MRLSKRKSSLSCFGHTGKAKMRFTSEQAAYDWINENHHKGMKVYRCPDCKGVHIAHGRN